MRTILVVELLVRGQQDTVLMTRFATGMESMQIGDTVQLEHDDSAPVKCMSRFWEVNENIYTLELVLSDARFDSIQARTGYVTTMESRGWMRDYPGEERWSAYERSRRL